MKNSILSRLAKFAMNRSLCLTLLLASLGAPAEAALNKVFFTTSNATASEDKLFSANLDGTSPTLLDSGANLAQAPGRLAFDAVNNRLYVCDAFTAAGRVYRYDVTGGGTAVTNKITIFTDNTSGTAVAGVAVDQAAGFVFFTTSNAAASGDNLYRCGLDGSSITTLRSGATFTAAPGDVALNPVAQTVYVADRFTAAGAILRCGYDGSSQTTILTDNIASTQMLGLEVDAANGFIYFTKSSATASEDKLIRCTLAGGSLTVLTSDAALATAPVQVSLDRANNNLFVADGFNAIGGVFRFDSAGANRQTIYTNSTSGSQVSGVVVGTAAAPPTTTVTSLNRVNPATSNLSTVNWTLTFAAANTGVTASNFSLSGAAATGATVGTPTTANSGLTWNVPVTTGSTAGTLTLNLANATGTTPGVSTTLPFAGQSYTMDKTAPTLVSIVRQTPTSQATTNTSATFRVTFSEAVNAPAASNFAIAAVSSSITGTIGTVTAVNASTYDVPVTITGGSGEFRLKVQD
ncbi:MAG: hypothetical protein NTV80_02935 [Verrucomicrobia bacterium]|nr:hypothetical protein [Verrucomicrobiota bacterium]